jgi:hypothetical protein
MSSEADAAEPQDRPRHPARDQHRGDDHHGDHDGHHERQHERDPHERRRAAAADRRPRQVGEQPLEVAVGARPQGGV